MTVSAQQNNAVVAELLSLHGKDRSHLITVLQDIQQHFGYLPRQAVTQLAQRTGISANEIYGVATFYAQFRFIPPGEHIIQVCQGTACHVRGSWQLLQELQQRLGIKPGQTTADGRFDLRRVACIGCCALAPVVTVDGNVHARMTPKEIALLVKQHSGKKDR
ncbi:MAG: NADH-quinone oxidoreductase subunit NuoE [Proteobacteria bacterium]|nr:NADH-quinone oxidoreductase subunit NuoE [Pseudomonadota bacterium]MBU2574439.1 NADH-quinone oxidoreductase subunit NuoE [Elusimicrobiota bacterium]